MVRRLIQLDVWTHSLAPPRPPNRPRLLVLLPKLIQRSKGRSKIPSIGIIRLALVEPDLAPFVEVTLVVLAGSRCVGLSDPS